MNAKQFWAAVAAFFALNGVGEFVYLTFVECVYVDPIFGCENRAGTHGLPVGIASQGAFVGAWFVVGVVAAVLAALHDW